MLQDSPYKKDLQVYRKCVKETALPPSRFSTMIIDYIDKFPLDERGWRPMFDFVGWEEREHHRKQLFRGFRAVYMNQTQIVKFEIGKEEGLLEVYTRKNRVQSQSRCA